MARVALPHRRLAPTICQPPCRRSAPSTSALNARSRRDDGAAISIPFECGRVARARGRRSNPASPMQTRSAVPALFRLDSAAASVCSVSVISVPSGNAGSSAVALGYRQGLGQPLGRVWHAPFEDGRFLQLAGALRLLAERRLEAAVGDRQHGGDAVAVGLAAQVGDAVLGDDDVAQVPRHGGVGVAPDDVAGRPCCSCWRVARTARTERAPSSACAIVTRSCWPPAPLTTRPSSSMSEEAAPSSVTTIAVLTKRASRRCSRFRASSPSSVLVKEMEVIAYVGELVIRHVAQLAIERLVADEEAGVQRGVAALPVGHATFEDARALERQERVDQHLGATVQALANGARSASGDG